MLSKIKIDGLYGLYSYELDFHPEQHPYRFVTGPNAYGKTSLLRIIASLFHENFRELAEVVFDEFDLWFDDGFSVSVTQERFFDSSEESDEVLPQRVVLTFRSGREGGEGEVFQWVSDGVEEFYLNNLTAYLSSHPIYLITDNRLYVGGSGATMGLQLQESMKSILKELERTLNTALQQGMLEEQEPIEKAEYNRRAESLRPLVTSMLKYGLVGKNPLPEWSESKAAFCHSCIKALDDALEVGAMDWIARLDAFCNIIDNYAFANKRLELSPYFGFRFKADDEMASILSFDQLSSGERHIVLMNYDVLFDVADEALVLTDEPELSFHLEWQGQFMQNLEELVGVRKDLQFIICTHAPEMFGYDWGVSVDLFDQSK